MTSHCLELQPTSPKHMHRAPTYAHTTPIPKQISPEGKIFDLIDDNGPCPKLFHNYFSGDYNFYDVAFKFATCTHPHPPTAWTGLRWSYMSGFLHQCAGKAFSLELYFRWESFRLEAITNHKCCQSLNVDFLQPSSIRHQAIPPLPQSDSLASVPRPY